MFRLHNHIAALSVAVTFAAALVSIVAAEARDQAADKEKTESIKVEIRGQLQTGVLAIGGETTGVTITASNLTFELDFKDGSDLAAKAEGLNSHSVVVTGKLEGRKGVEIPLRYIVSVESLKPAE
jgi:hypothetical protein